MLKSIKDKFKHIFSKKKIVIISEHNTVNINIPTYVQLVVLLFIIGASIWFPYSAGRVAGYDVKSENEMVLIENYDNVEYRVHQIEKNLNTLEQYMKALKSTGVSVKRSEVEEEGSSLNQTQHRDKLSMLEEKQYKLVADFYKNTESRIDVIEDVLKSVKIDYTSAAKAAGIDKHVGGPYIPIDSTEEAKNYFIGEEFAENFKYLFYLKKMANKLPLMSPLDKPRVTSHYGARRDPIRKTRAMHSGIDLVSDRDASVYVTAPGVVISAGRHGAYGKMVKVKHESGFETRYAHLKMVNVYAGQKVKRGDVIGIQGSTGRSTGTHLHYEIRKNGRHFNPAKFLKQAHKLDFDNINFR